MASLEHCVRLYRDGKPMLARVARDTGVLILEMMDYARARKVPAQYDFENLERNLGTGSMRLWGQDNTWQVCH